MKLKFILLWLLCVQLYSRNINLGFMITVLHYHTHFTAAQKINEYLAESSSLQFNKFSISVGSVLKGLKVDNNCCVQIRMKRGSF